MEYRKIVRRWMGNLIDKGLSVLDAYVAVFGQFRKGEAHYGELAEQQAKQKLRPIGRPMRRGATSLDLLREYVSNPDYGFLHGDDWYFRVTWLNPQFRWPFEEAGIITRVGTVRDLAKIGAHHPFSGNQGRAVFYRVSRKKLEIGA